MLQHGLIDLSLRPLAAALGTNARMSPYHFGSKEVLIVQVLTAEADPAARFGQLWPLLTSPELTPFFRSLFEIELRAIDGEALYRQFARELLLGWLGLVQANLTSDSAPAANFVMAALTGLLPDRFSTGVLDRRRGANGPGVWRAQRRAA